MIDLTPKQNQSQTVEASDLLKEVVEQMRQREAERPAREKREREDARAKALAELAALPIEERLARIEAWIYDFRPQYVPEPTFR